MAAAPSPTDAEVADGGLEEEFDADLQDMMDLELPVASGPSPIEPKAEKPHDGLTWDNHAIETVLELSLAAHDKDTFELWQDPRSESEDWKPQPLPLPSWIKPQKEVIPQSP